MTFFTLEGVDALLRENRGIQVCISARIQVLNESIADAEDLLFRLKARSTSGTRKKNREDRINSRVLESNFGFCYGSVLIEPQVSVPQLYHCLPLLTKFRWFPRAVKILKSQVDRFGLDSKSCVDDPLKWQVVADAVNYESKAAVKIIGMQCYLYYKHMVASSSTSFTDEEDELIVRFPRDCGPLGWRSLAADINEQYNCIRTPFHVAQRYRVLRRCKYEANISAEETCQVITSHGHNVAELSLNTDALVCIAHGINKKISPPWLTEDGIRRSILWERWRLLSYEESLKRNICAALLSFDSFLSLEARYLLREVIQCDPLEFSDLSRNYKTCYSQISVEEAAHQLSASVTDMSTRIVKKAQHYHSSTFAADFFRISNDLFGHRNAARACFLIAREYERKSFKLARLSDQFGVKRIMASMKDVKNEE